MVTVSSNEFGASLAIAMIMCKTIQYYTAGAFVAFNEKSVKILHCCCLVLVLVLV